MKKSLIIFLFSGILASGPIKGMGADIQKDLNNQLRLIWFEPNFEKLSTLLKQGADPNFIVDQHYHERLINKLAHTDENIELVRVLIAHGASVNNENNIGFHSSALHSAALGPAPGCASVLLKAGAEVNCTTSLGDTPLHLLLLYTEFKPKKYPFFLKTAKILIDAGARLDIPSGESKRKKTAIQLAICRKLPEFTDLFRKTIAGPMYQNLKLLAKDENNYFGYLPAELLQEVALFYANDEYMEKGKLG